jgi:hypothetical protein
MSEPRMLRPMEYGEIFNEAFDLYKRNFGLFAGIGAVIYVPFYLLTALGERFPLVTGLAVLLLYIPLVVANGAIIKALTDRYLGKEATIAGSWGYVLRRLVPYFFTAVLAWLMVMGGFVLLCVPGIIAAFWIYFVCNVMIVEDRYYSDAIRRSRELAAGQWLRILVIVLLSLILYLAVTGIVAVLAGVQFALTASASRPGAVEVPLWLSLTRGAVQALMQSVVAPIVSLMNVILYFDVRVRKEGYDIELLAQEMGEAPPGGSPGIAPA